MMQFCKTSGVTTMDHSKCKALKTELRTQPEPQVVPIERFFDGNDDLGSIGCNLLDHPGVNTFRNVLTGLLRRPDVESVYAQIAELDPGEGCWPFTDTVLVVGTISAEALSTAVDSLEPDEVAPVQEVSPSIAERHGSPVLAVWWD